MIKIQNRRGFTLVETLVSLTILSILIVTTLAAVDRQVKLFSQGSSQMDAIQNGRFALNTLEKDLPTAGTNTAGDQPFLIYADTHVVAFNADYVSNRINDVSAIYVDTAASDFATTAVMTTRQFMIPRTNVVYPEVNYTVGAQNSPAETIIFFFMPDTVTPRTDDYALYRQVNNQPSELISRGILKQGTTPFFTYQRRVTPASGNPYMQTIGAPSLPQRHIVPRHLAVGDTGNLAIIDQLRAVQVNYRVTDDRPGAQERVFNISRTIALPNAGLGAKQTCGDVPILGNVGFAAVPQTVAGQRVVRLSWNQAVDEAGGEKDVVRYVIYRQNVAGALTDPYLSIPSGQPNYVFVDTGVTVGTSYYYSIAAQDCTPSLSDPLSLAPVIP